MKPLRFLLIALFLLTGTAFNYAQWETIATIESAQFLFPSGSVWVPSANGSPYDCSNLSIQKNPAQGDLIWVTQNLDFGFIYRYTFYIKTRQPTVLCQFLEGTDETVNGNTLGYAYNQQGSDDYTYNSGKFEIAVSPAMVCGDTFKYTSGTVVGDGQLHYFKLHLTDVQEIAYTAPLRVGHCIIERKVDNTYQFPFDPSNLNFSSIENKSIQLKWDDNSDNESGFVVERAFNSEIFEKYDTLDANSTTFIDAVADFGEYKYRVFAYNNEGNSKASNSISTILYNNPPPNPSDLAGVSIDSRNIVLEWSDNSENEYGFKVEYGQNEVWESAPASPVDSNSEWFLLSGLTALTNYSIRVYAWNNMGTSDTLIIALQTSDHSNDGMVFPDDAGILNVRDFGAMGNGITDDTKAIQEAMKNGANNYIYFPIGTYLVSDRLEWPTGARKSPMIMVGQKKDETIIMLSDNNIKYQNPSFPYSVIWTQEMESADNFRNFIKNLTVNTGSGNPAAVGIQFMSNNMGSISNVDIVSGDGEGETGLDLAYKNLNGPLLINNVRIDGFNFGIKTSGAVNSQTLEHITLLNQKIYGFQNNGQVANVRGIISNNSVPAIFNKAGAGVFTLLDSELTGGSSSNPAILNQGVLFARNIQTTGYQKAIDNLSGHGMDVTDNDVGEFVSHPVSTQFAWTKPLSLNLEIKETPEVSWKTDLNEWANVRSFGAIPDDNIDDTPAIRDAIASGKSVVYFPHGTYNISGSVELSGNVERIIGFESLIAVGTQEEAVFILSDNPGAPSIVEIQHLAVTPENTTPAVNNQSSDRTLVIRYCKGFGGNHTGRGEVYYEDTGTGVSKPVSFTGGAGQKAWIRQLSNEPKGGVTHITNDGGMLWILGHKTEQPGTLVETKNGGKTEICGGFAYSVGGDNTSYPMYINDNSFMSATMGGAFFAKDYDTYSIMVKEIHGPFIKTLNASALPIRAGFRMIPLYVGYPDDGTGTVPDAPDNLTGNVSDLGAFILNWNDNSSNETGFAIEMSTDNSSFKAIDSTTLNVTSIILTDLEVEKKYCFRVSAFNEIGNSTHSNEICDTLTLINVFGANYLNEGFINFFPNPFSEEVNIQIELPFPAEVNIQLFDLTGRKIRDIMNSRMEEGKYIHVWDGFTNEGSLADYGVFNARVQLKLNDNTYVFKNFKIIHIK